MKSSIIFEPEIPDRELDREADKVNESLSDAGRIDVDADTSGMDGLGGVGGGGRIGGGMSGGVGGAAGAGALASKIPKPIAGVTAAAALPVALAGGVGVGIADAMMGASARLQTSASLLGQAWNNVWRPLGNRIDELFIRDTVKDVVSATQDFETHLNNAFNADRFASAWADRVRAMSDLFQIAPGPFGDAMSAGLELSADVIDGDVKLPSFQWPSPSMLASMFKWPTTGALVAKFAWPTAQSLASDFEWPSIDAPEWPSTSEIMDEFPSINVQALQHAIAPDIFDEPGSSGDGGGNPEDGPGFGGDRFRPRSGPTDTNTSNTTTSEAQQSREQDERVVSELKRMRRGMENMSIKVGEDEFGRVVSDSQQNGTFDTDPTA